MLICHLLGCTSGVVGCLWTEEGWRWQGQGAGQLLHDAAPPSTAHAEVAGTQLPTHNRHRRGSTTPANTHTCTAVPPVPLVENLLK